MVKYPKYLSNERGARGTTVSANKYAKVVRGYTNGAKILGNEYSTNVILKFAGLYESDRFRARRATLVSQQGRVRNISVVIPTWYLKLEAWSLELVGLTLVGML